MAGSSDETKTRSKAPRKRAVRKSVAKTKDVSEPKKKVTRKRATPKKDEPEKVIEKKEESPVIKPKESTKRKAPTPISANKIASKKKVRQRIIVGLLVLIGVGSSAAVGLSDEGQIDVMETIEARNERIRTNTTDERDVLVSNLEVPVQNTSAQGKPDGGLVGKGIVEALPVEVPEADLASSTATSSLEIASSTEAMTASSTEESIESETEPTTEAEDKEIIEEPVSEPTSEPEPVDIPDAESTQIQES